MNRLLMLLISFLLTGITQAQYVGIGTTTPAKILDVNGDALINGLTIGMGSGNISTNTAIGNSVLSSNTTALGNTAVGYESQKLTTTGIANTSIGFMSMANNSEGYYNVSLGAWTLNQNSNGYHNTAVGYGSLYSNNTGFENTGLGYGAAMGAGNLQNATAIGAKAYAAASNSLILGSVAGVNGAVNSVNVGIGTTTPTANLDVEGSVRLADGTQALGFVLTSDNNGVATWKPGANPALEGLLCNL